MLRGGMRKYLLSFLILGPLLSLLWLALLVTYRYHRPYSGPTRSFEIKKGESFARINHRLGEQGLISAPRLFYKLAQWRGVVEKLRPGSYKITHGMAMAEVMDVFLLGAPVVITVTIAEGKNMFEIAKILHNKGLGMGEEFLAGARNREFLTSLGVWAERAEGYLYPDTYSLEPGMRGREVVAMMVKNFFRQMATIDYQKSPFTLHEFVTLASIVEKETGAAEERPMIAGVFLNRLRKSMRLQSDPTTIYGIYQGFNGNLRKKHLLQKTPYNTYQISGLPVGPIANPGLDAMRAVLNPRQHRFLYFVSKNDGTHVFTANYRDHLRAVKNWQKNRANRKGKSWRHLAPSRRAKN